MHVLAARISKTAIPWRTRGPDGRRGQLRFVAGMAGDSESSPPARCSHGVMDAQCYSRDGGDSESSPAGEVLSWCHGCTVLQSGWLAIVNPVRHARCSTWWLAVNPCTWCHGCTVLQSGLAGDSECSPAGGQYGWPSSSTRQHDTKPLWKLGRGTISTVHQQPHATGGEQAAPDEQRILRRPATVACHHVAGAGRKCCVVRTPRFIVACHPVTGSWKEGLCGTMGAFGARGRKGLFVSHCPARFARQPVRNWG
jgi:hypothetical protein